MIKMQTTYVWYLALCCHIQSLLCILRFGSDVDSSDSEGEVCGMDRPSLVEELRAVLDEYPDNGQIFKVLIRMLIDDQLGFRCIAVCHTAFSKCTTPFPHL